jgi:hypothetical protein
MAPPVKSELARVYAKRFGGTVRSWEKEPSAAPIKAGDLPHEIEAYYDPRNSGFWIPTSEGDWTMGP